MKAVTSTCAQMKDMCFGCFKKAHQESWLKARHARPVKGYLWWFLHQTTKLTELEKQESVQLVRVAAMLSIKTVQLFIAQVQIFVCLIPSFCGSSWVHVWKHAAGAGIPFRTPEFSWWRTRKPGELGDDQSG